MADDFERRLERLFADAPELPDAAAFAGRVEGRLDRGWTMRRMLIGVAGVVGGAIGAGQLLTSNVFQQVESASQGSARAMSGLSRVAPQVEWWSLVTSGGTMVWVASGLAIVAMGFVLSRVIEEI